MKVDRSGDHRRRLAFIAVVAIALAAVAFGVSFIVGPTMKAGTPITTSPVSVAAGINQSLPASDQAIGGVPAQGTETLTFGFQMQSPAGDSTLFNAQGASAVIRRGPAHDWTMLFHFLNGGPDYSFPIVHGVLPGRWYTVSIRLTDRDAISASVDGRQQFEVTAPPTTLSLTFHPCVLGSPKQAGAGSVALRDFAVTRQVDTMTSATLQTGLRVLGGFLVAIAAILLLSFAVTGRRILRFLGLAPARVPGGRRRQTWRSWLATPRWRLVALGLGAVAVGVTLLIVATPPENNVVVRTGGFHLTAPEVGPRAQHEEDLGALATLGQSTSTMDVTLSFQLLVRNPKGSDQLTVVTTQDPANNANNNGIGFFLDAQRALWSTLTYGPDGGATDYQLSSGAVPLGRWQHVEVQLTRGQKVTFSLNGALVGYQEFSAPGWLGSAQTLTVGTTYPQSDVTIRDTAMTESLYGAPVPRTKVLFSRSVQVLGFLLIVTGIFLAASRAFGRIFGARSSGSRPLVLVVFGVAAIGILLNLLIDLLHLQSGGSPYITRNTWVFSLYDSFTDFLNPLQVFKARNAYSNLSASYPPIAYWLVAPFYWSPPFSDLFIYLASFLGFFFWWLWHSLLSSLRGLAMVAIGLVALASFPMTYALSRANIDISLFVLFAVLVACLEHERLRSAASLIGLTIAAKVVPALFLVVFLRKGRWRFIWLAAAVAFSATLLGFLWFSGDLSSNVHHFVTAFTSTQKPAKSWNPIQVSFGTNLSVWAQAMGYAVNGVPGGTDVANVMKYVELPLEVVGTLFLAWYVGFADREPWRVVTLVVTAILVLPTPSGDYELLYLFVPIVLFLRFAPTSQRHLFIALTFGLLLAPRVYFFIGPQFVGTDTLLNAPLLMLLSVLVVRDGLAARPRRRERVRALALEDPKPADRRVAVG